MPTYQDGAKVAKKVHAYKAKKAAEREKEGRERERVEGERAAKVPEAPRQLVRD